MSKYTSYASALQSRLSKRATKIRENEAWKVHYHERRQMMDYDACKKLLKYLSEEQALDKKLLKVLQEVSYISDLEDEYLSITYGM